METTTIGTHEIVLKEAIIKKDIVPLSKLEKIYKASIENGAVTEDAEAMVAMNDLLIEIMVLSIDGVSDRTKVKDIVDNLSVPEYTELSRCISEKMNELQKKSEISSTSMSAS